MSLLQTDEVLLHFAGHVCDRILAVRHPQRADLLRRTDDLPSDEEFLSRHHTLVEVARIICTLWRDIEFQLFFWSRFARRQ